MSTIDLICLIISALSVLIHTIAWMVFELRDRDDIAAIKELIFLGTSLVLMILFLR